MTPARFLGSMGAALSLIWSPLAAQSPDSLVKMLDSPDWQVRADAAVRLYDVPVAEFPASAASTIIALLEREALKPDTIPPAVGESYGEYEIDLVGVALRLKDPASLRGMALLGIQTGSDAKRFVASYGATSLPFLEEAWQRSAYGRNDVLITLGMMLGQYPDKLTDDAAATARSMILRGWTENQQDGVVWAALRGPLPDLAPLVDDLAASKPDDGFLVRARPRLDSMRDRTATPDLARELGGWLAAICAQANDARVGACESLQNLLTDARKQITAGRTTPAVNTLRAFVKRANQARIAGVLTDAEHRLLVGNGAYLIDRLGQPPGRRH
jgi:hypothetical protein